MSRFGFCLSDSGWSLAGLDSKGPKAMIAMINWDVLALSASGPSKSASGIPRFQMSMHLHPYSSLSLVAAAVLLLVTSTFTTTTTTTTCTADDTKQKC